METEAGPKAGGFSMIQHSRPKNCGYLTPHPPALTRHLQAGKCKPLQKAIDSDTAPENETAPTAGRHGSSSAASEKAPCPSSSVAATSGETANDVGQALSTKEACVGQKRKKYI